MSDQQPDLAQETIPPALARETTVPLAVVAELGRRITRMKLGAERALIFKSLDPGEKRGLPISDHHAIALHLWPRCDFWDYALDSVRTDSREAAYLAGFIRGLDRARDELAEVAGHVVLPIDGLDQWSDAARTLFEEEAARVEGFDGFVDEHERFHHIRHLAANRLTWYLRTNCATAAEEAVELSRPSTVQEVTDRDIADIYDELRGNGDPDVTGG